MIRGTRLYIVSYDISNDKRRGDIADYLMSFGHRIQFSVFSVESPRARFLRMKAGLLEMINSSEDSLLLCDLGPCAKGKRRFETIGKKSVVDPDSSSFVY